MSTREEPRQLRLASWQQIFADRAASGLSVKDYCEANNLKRDQYFYLQSIARKMPWQLCLRILPDLHCLRHQNRSLQPQDFHRIDCQV